MAGGDALERVGDEVPRPALRLDLRLLVELAHAAREVVPDQLLRLREEPRLGLVDGHPGDPLELLELALLRLLQVVLELLDVDLAVGEALLAPLDLLLAPLDLVLSCDRPFLDLRDPRALLGDLLLDLGAQADGVLAGLDLRLAADRLGFPPGLGHARPAEQLQADEHEGARDQDADQNCRNHEHGTPRVRAGAAQLSECCGPVRTATSKG